MAGTHAPTAEALKQLATAFFRASFVENTHSFGAHGHSRTREPVTANSNKVPFDLHAGEQNVLFSATQSLNISHIPVAAPTFHADKSWLNALALRNAF